MCLPETITTRSSQRARYSVVAAGYISAGAKAKQGIAARQQVTTSQAAGRAKQRSKADDTSGNDASQLKSNHSSPPTQASVFINAATRLWRRTRRSESTVLRVLAVLIRMVLNVGRLPWRAQIRTPSRGARAVRSQEACPPRTVRSLSADLPFFHDAFISPLDSIRILSFFLALSPSRCYRCSA